MSAMENAFGNAGVLKTRTKAKQVSPAPNDVRIPTINKVKETAAVAEKRQYIVDIPAHVRGLVNRIRHIQMVSLEELAQAAPRNLPSDTSCYPLSHLALLDSANITHKAGYRV